MSSREYSSDRRQKPTTLMRPSRFVTRIGKPWNERFHIMTTKDNQKLHLFYKELFGKPSHK